MNNCLTDNNHSTTGQDSIPTKTPSYRNLILPSLLTTHDVKILPALFKFVKSNILHQRWVKKCYVWLCIQLPLQVWWNETISISMRYCDPRQLISQCDRKCVYYYSPYQQVFTTPGNLTWLYDGLDTQVHAPSQWETTLQCNVVSHWLGAYIKWSLIWRTNVIWVGVR